MGLNRHRRAYLYVSPQGTPFQGVCFIFLKVAQICAVGRNANLAYSGIHTYFSTA